MRLIFFLFLVVFVSACKQKSEAYFHDRGNELLAELTLKLQKINDVDSLMQQSQELEELFQSLVTVLIEAHKWQMKTKKTISTDRRGSQAQSAAGWRVKSPT